MKAKIFFSLAFIIFSINFISSKAYADYYKAELRSGWSYYDKELIMHSSEATSKPFQVNLPIEFKDMDLETENYGTFVKTITIPNHFLNQKMGIELPFVYSAAKIYIDGVPVKEVGHVGTNANDHKTDLQTVITSFTPTSKQIEIAIQLSSFNHIRGGFSSPPVVGDWDSIYQNYLLERYTVIFVTTIILIVGIATFTIGVMNRKEKLFFTFGLFSIVVAIREIVTVPFIYHELPITLSYVLATKLEYITSTLCFMLYNYFVYLLYNKLFSKKILYFNISILMIIVLICIFTEPKIFQIAFFSFFPILVLFVLYNIWIMLRALALKLHLAKSLLFGIFFLLLGALIDFMSGIGIVSFPPVTGFMAALNVLLILSALCMNYVNYVNRLTQLNTELDELVKKRTSQLDLANSELQKMVNLDSLTKVYNRHKFDESIKKEFERSIRKNSHLSLLMLDLDEFKKYNDYYGHVAGDELLIQFAKIALRVIPNNATFARYGGEEFVIILPEFSLDDAMGVAEKIRHAVEAARIENLGRTYGIVTVSIGCAERITNQIPNEVDLIKVADERLYLSKVNGRNRVTAQS